MLLQFTELGCQVFPLRRCPEQYSRPRVTGNGITVRMIRPVRPCFKHLVDLIADSRAGQRK